MFRIAQKVYSDYNISFERIKVVRVTNAPNNENHPTHRYIIKVTKKESDDKENNLHQNYRTKRKSFDDVDEEDRLGKFIVSCAATASTALQDTSLYTYKQWYLRTGKTLIGNPISSYDLQRIKDAKTFAELDTIIKEINTLAKKA